MKKTSNKGFSMVELIIVIAIMAILAAALAPSLIKYINKSRLSTDVTTGTTIATAVNSALAVEKAYDSCKSYESSFPMNVDTLIQQQNGNSFAAEVAAVLGYSGKTTASIKGKSKKDIKGNDFTAQNFLISVDQVNNKVEVWYGTPDDDHKVSPSVGASMTE